MKFDKQTRDKAVVDAGTYLSGLLLASVFFASFRVPRTVPVVALIVVILFWREMITARMRGELARLRREQQQSQPSISGP
jgi:hypothetical protein